MTKYDLMNAETKQSIQQAFLNLLLEKDFTKITIQQIANTAKVNRGTFYFHFEDKYDLIQKIEDQLIDRLTVVSANLTPSTILNDARAGDIPNFEVFQFIEDNKIAFRALLSAHGDFRFAKRLRTFFMTQFLAKYKDSNLLPSNSQVPIEYVASFASSAFLGVIEHWLSSGSENAEQAAKYYLETILVVQQIK